jgi:hypothetical protein
MMFGMNQDQVTNLVRQFLMIFGTLATTLGWATPDKIAGWTATILALVGPVFMTTSLVWGLVKNTQSGIISSAAAQVDASGTPVVRNINLNPMATGTAELSKTTPANVTVGSPGGSGL